MEQEIRQFNVELRACCGEKKRTISGRAIPFNIFSPNREGFRECISPAAVEGVIEKSDIKMLYNHDNSKGFMARKNKNGKGCLRIDVKEDGVYFEFDAKNDNLSNYIYERIENGELDEMSWAFTVAEEEWKKCDDGVYERTITKFEQLYDFSIVDNSYYGIENAVGCKRFAEIQEEERIENEKKMQELKEAEEKEEAEKRAQEEAEKEEALKQYYNKLREDNAKYI